MLWSESIIRYKSDIKLPENFSENYSIKLLKKWLSPCIYTFPSPNSLNSTTLTVMPKTPAKGDLLFAEMEIEQLNTLFSSHIGTTVIEVPERVKILSALRDHQFIHS